MPTPGWADEYELKGYVPYDLMPRLYNPARHYIVAANQEVAPPHYFAMLNKKLGPNVNAHFGSMFNKWVYGYRSQRIDELGMKGYNTSRMGRPEVNAALGAYYLRHVLDGFGGNPVLAAAAYNAGPGRARRWCDAKPLEGAIYVETIPFAETRQYVKKVMANTVYYAAVMDGDQRSLKSRLGMIKGAMTMKAEADE